MDTVTYPDAAVSRFLDVNFAAVRIDISRVAPEHRELLRASKPQWAPSFLCFDGDVELRRWTGYLPPERFVTQLKQVIAQRQMIRRDFAAAAETLSDIAGSGDPDAAPEALFWLGAAVYRRDQRDLDALERVWTTLRERFPDSPWAIKADVFDMK